MKKCTTGFTAASAAVYNENDIVTLDQFNELPETEQSNFTDCTEEEVEAYTAAHQEQEA